MALFIIANSGKISYGIKHYLCDTLDDIPFEDNGEAIAPGSTVYVIDSKKTYMYNSKGQWIEIITSGGSGGASALSGLTDVSLSQLKDGEYLVYDVESGMWKNGTGKDIYAELQGILTAGETTVTLTSDYITANSVIEDYVDDTFDGVEYISREVTDGNVTYTFPAQESDMPVMARVWIKGVGTAGVEIDDDETNLNSTWSSTKIAQESEKKVDKTEFADEYDDSSSYSVGDLTIHNDKYYINITAIPDPGEEFDPTKWQEVSLSDIFTNVNNKMDKVNPTGSGSFSLNRKANTTIGTDSVAVGYNTTASGNYSHAEGSGTTAYGDSSHAEGNSSIAAGDYSHAEGKGTASKPYAHAEGCETNAPGQGSHAEGYRTVAVGDYSHAEGSSSQALGGSSHAENYSKAEGTYSHSEGNSTAKGQYSHAEGSYTTTTQTAAHSEGQNSTASGQSSHAEGYYTKASGQGSHAEGANTTALGNYSHVEGSSTKANAENAHAEGYNTTASGVCSHAEGCGTTASGDYSHSEGYYSQATYQRAHAEGYYTKAFQVNSHAEGIYTTASGESSHAEGSNTTASGTDSHAEGAATTATNLYAHAEGNGTHATGISSHAEGQSTTASGSNSHAEGNYTTASGDLSHAEGYNTTATHYAQHVFGTCNILDESTNPATEKGTYVEIVGNGTDGKNPSNARTLDWQGNEVLAGDLTINGNQSVTQALSKIVIQKTQAEYDLLTTEQKMNGSIYKITDNAKMYCLDEEYRPVKELTTAQYEALTTAEKNNGTIYIQTDAETTGSDIPVSSSDNTSVAEAVSNSIYHVGDNVFIAGIVSLGYITSNAKSLRFYIPLNKPFNQTGVRNISLNDITMAIRMIDGSYLLNNAKLSTISNSVRVYSNGMGLYVQAEVNAPSNFNNIPCAVQIMEYEQNIITLA